MLAPLFQLSRGLDVIDWGVAHIIAAKEVVKSVGDIAVAN